MAGNPAAALAERPSGFTTLTKPRKAALPPEALRELNQIEELVGGRGEIIASLVTAPQTESMTYLIGLLADPERKDLTLAEVCSQARLLPTDILEALIIGKKARAKVVATHMATDDLPRVVKDIVKRAGPYTDTCYRCAGRGEYQPGQTDDQKEKGVVPPIQPCEVCNRYGTLVYPADEESRKLMLELAGLLQKGGGTNISILQQQKTLTLNAAGAGGGDGVAMQEAIDKILWGDGGGGDAGEAEDSPLEANPPLEAAPLPIIDLDPEPEAVADPSAAPLAHAVVMPPLGRRPEETS